MKKILVAFVFLTGCTTVTTPVLRHETGESLGGSGNFKAYAHIERARLVPVVGASSTAASVAQKDDVFAGALLGV